MKRTRNAGEQNKAKRERNNRSKGRESMRTTTWKQRHGSYPASLTGQEKRLRITAAVLCECVTLFTLLRLTVLQEYSHLDMCIGTFFMVLIPAAVEYLFACRLHPALYLFGELYSMLPMVGECYKLYYNTTWWDKLLHIFGGFAFALFGAFLLLKLTKTSPLLAVALFAFCFSVTVSAVWEFVEYGCDRYLGQDMQQDTVVSEIHSHLLSEEPGGTAHIVGIHETSIGGERMPIDGYLELGLNDTMQDMLIETLGALLASAAILLDRGKHKLFLPLEGTAAQTGEHPRISRREGRQ